MSSALERIDALEKKVQELDARSANAYSFAEEAVKRGVSFSQQLAATAKTMTALISTLTAKEIVASEEILDGIRKIDEDNAREEIEGAVASGWLKKAEVVAESSLVVLKQVAIPTGDDPTPILLADYRTLELPSPLTPPDVRKQLVGKKIGETVTFQGDKATIVTTVKEVYEAVEVVQGGEAQPQAEQGVTDGSAAQA